MLPSLDPLPSTTIQTLRGVINVVLDDMELDWGGPGSEDKSTDMTVVVVRRKGLGIYRVGARMVPVKVSTLCGFILKLGNTSTGRTYRCSHLFHILMRRHSFYEYIQSHRSCRSVPHGSPARHAD
jgi:hypothetical protein